MIAVVDYLKGNLKSVERGLVAAGADARITSDAGEIARADAIVLPGVGAFADAAATMAELGQTSVIRDRVAAGVPFLGICLGLHLMFEEGTEGAPEEDDEVSSHNAKGLAILPGVVTKMPRTDDAGTSYKVPHVGWNTVELAAASPGTRSSRDAGDSRSEVRVASAIPRISGTGETLADKDEPAPVEAPASVCAPSRAGSVGLGACPLFAGIPSGTHFYFTHSYIVPDTPATVAVTEHSVTFPSAVQFRDAAFGVQFHPEKSSDAGAAVLRNFVGLVKGA